MSASLFFFLNFFSYGLCVFREISLKIICCLLVVYNDFLVNSDLHITTITKCGTFYCCAEYLGLANGSKFWETRNKRCTVPPAATLSRMLLSVDRSWRVKGKEVMPLHCSLMRQLIMKV